MIIAIDPANVQTAWVLMDDEYLPISFNITKNEELLSMIHDGKFPKKEINAVAIEMIASYGMKVGQTVFDTCVWIGIFKEAFEQQGMKVHLIYRKDVKMNLCGTMRSNDSTVRSALIKRFGNVGTKSKNGWFYGFKADLWAAYAVGVYFIDKRITERMNN